MALPLLFMAGASVVRAATPAIARYLAKQGLKRATGAAAKKPVSSTVTSIKQAQKLKPSTKVVGKGTKPASMQSGAPKSPPKPLRADPKDRVSTPAKKSKTTAAGTTTQRRIAGAGVTAASLATLIPKKESGKSQATTKSGPSKKTTVSDAQKRGQVRTRPAAKEKNYNVGVSKGGVSFNEAFAHFRKKGNKTFTWNGKKYNTKTKEEARKSKADKVKNLVAKAVKSSKGNA